MNSKILKILKRAQARHAERPFESRGMVWAYLDTVPEAAELFGETRMLAVSNYAVEEIRARLDLAVSMAEKKANS